MTYNKDWYKKWNKKYYEVHKGELRIKKQTYYTEHIKPRREKTKHSPEYIYIILKHRSKVRHKDIISREEFIEWYNNEEKKCFYCGILPQENSRLTIDRLDNKKGYEKGNIALACFPCNKVKGETLTTQEMKIVGELVMKRRWS